jgi:hypothetical protein
MIRLGEELGDYEMIDHIADGRFGPILLCKHVQSGEDRVLKYF